MVKNVWSYKGTVRRIKNYKDNILRKNTFQIMNLIKNLYPEFTKSSQNSIEIKQTTHLKNEQFEQNTLQNKIKKLKINT